MQTPVMQGCRIEIRAIWPDQRMHLGIEPDAIEHLKVAQRPIDFAQQNRAKVDALCRPVVKLNSQRVGGQDFKSDDPVNGMILTFILAVR